ncbi:hypothetical protein BGE01nite_46340 [Brevifollis gellanilyticus]|uniref:Uncharacterized protein n=2 Tax=Brevifollis gellanilyticus TaxID=748831 RepID=A0A512MF32_9BACT|nr:hypothetical protein BGE01nite_46340 [Brevifollis gellanilyticus]
MKVSLAMNSPSQPSLPGVVDVLRVNERLIIALAMLAGLPFTLAVVGVMMRVCGASLKPEVFAVGVAAASIIAVVALFVAQWVRARIPVRPEEPGPGFAIQGGKFADREKVFGADVPAFLIRDAKAVMPGVFDEAEVAESGFTVNVETMLVAQFPTPREARKAALAYHRAFFLQNVTGDEALGWKARRSLQGDYVEMVRRGRVLFVWACLSPEACTERRQQCDIESLLPGCSVEKSAPHFSALQPVTETLSSLGWLLGRKEDRSIG